MKINGRIIGKGHPAYIIAEISANHNQSYDRAVGIINAAKLAGADAIKIQTYRADTITIDCDKEEFLIKGTLWDGMNLFQLYEGAQTPWEWQPKLKDLAESLGMDFFSSPFDETAVDFLESLDICAYKVASSELIDIPLLSRIGKTGRSVILSTGMAAFDEITEAIDTLKTSGAGDILLLKCTASYPAKYEEMNLVTIPDMENEFQLPIGLSDHSMGYEVAVAAVPLGACAIEKHLTLSRAKGGPDSGFSMEPSEFKAMVVAVRNVEKALGVVNYGPTESENASKLYRRSLYVVEEMKAGDVITPECVRSIRPGYGLHTRHLTEIAGRKIKVNTERGTPLTWEMID